MNNIIWRFFTQIIKLITNSYQKKIDKKYMKI